MATRNKVPIWGAGATGANMGDEAALFEPIHGSAPKYSGQNTVSPMAMMFSGVLMLRSMGEGDAADRLEHTTAAIIRAGKSVTDDMNPTATTPAPSAPRRTPTRSSSACRRRR